MRVAGVRIGRSHKTRRFLGNSTLLTTAPRAHTNSGASQMKQPPAPLFVEDEDRFGLAALLQVRCRSSGPELCGQSAPPSLRCFTTGDGWRADGQSPLAPRILRPGHRPAGAPIPP